MENISVVTVITLSAVNVSTSYRITIFTLTLAFYGLVLLLNISVIAAVVLDPRLHEPMYIILCMVCLNGVYGTTGFYPRFLWELLRRSNRISYHGCLLQAFVIVSFGSCEMSHLVLMALDRYLAICYPLRYHTLMTSRRLCVLVLLSWLAPLSTSSLTLALTSALKLCRTHVDKIFCVNKLITDLACSEANAARIVILSYSITVAYACNLALLAWSYTRLVATCARSKDSWAKFTQTCTPHLLSLAVFLSVVLFDLFHLNFVKAGIPPALKNLVSINFLLFPPLINPIIYGIKLPMVRHRIFYLFHGKRK